MSDECARCGAIMVIAAGAIVRSSGEVLEYCSEDCYAEGATQEHVVRPSLTATHEVVHDRD